MSVYLIEGEILQDIADAVREKKGSTEAILTENMATEIRGIGGGSTGGDIDALIDGSITEVSSGATKVCTYAFYKRGALASVNLPNVTSIDDYAFDSCTALASVYLPEATSIGKGAFYKCLALKSIELPKATSIAGNAFSTCTALASVYLQKATSIGTNAFYGCYAIKSITLLSDKVCTLESANSLYWTSDLLIYVPANLVDAYKSATNWSTYASQIRAIDEGGGDAEGNWLFQNEQIDSNGRNDLPIPVIGTSYTLFVDGEEIGTDTAGSEGQLNFATEDWRLIFKYEGYLWHFHPMDSQVQSGNVSIRING